MMFVSTAHSDSSMPIASIACRLFTKGWDYVHTPKHENSPRNFWDFVGAEEDFVAYLRAVIHFAEVEKHWKDFSLRIRSKTGSLLQQDSSFELSTFVSHLLSKSELKERDVCLSCDLENPVSKACLVKETEFNRCWIDAKGRSVFVVTPKKHYERLSDLSDEELLAFFADARDMLLSELCDCAAEGSSAKGHQKPSRKKYNKKKTNFSDANSKNKGSYDLSSGDARLNNGGVREREHESRSVISPSDDEQKTSLRQTSPDSADETSVHVSSPRETSCKDSIVDCPCIRYSQITINHGLNRNLEHLHMKIYVPKTVFKRCVRRWPQERTRRLHALMEKLGNDKQLANTVGAMGAFRGAKFFRGGKNGS